MSGWFQPPTQVESEFYENSFHPGKPTRQSTKKKTWIQDASPTKNGWTLAALPNISFRGFGSSLGDLGVSSFYLAATQRHHGLRFDRWKSRLHFVSFGFLENKWHGLFSQRGWVKKDPEKTLSKCVRVSSWWFVWFLCFLSNILRSCENSISFWDQAVVGKLTKIPHFEVKVGSKWLSIHLISVLPKKVQENLLSRWMMSCWLS